jgi:hypothetical protein
MTGIEKPKKGGLATPSEEKQQKMFLSIPSSFIKRTDKR